MFFCLICNNRVNAQVQNPLDQLVNINIAADSLINSLHKLELKTKLSFAFDSDQLRSKRNLPFTFVKAPLSTIIDKLLIGTGLHYKLVGNDIVIAPKKSSIWTISGHVRDANNGEELIGATVSIPQLDAGVNTNQYGFYSISIPAGVYEVLISNLGYQAQKLKLNLTENKEEEIELFLKTNKLQEVEIKQSAIAPNPILSNVQSLNAKQLNSATYYNGEIDVVKRLQMQNGIKALSEGSSGLFIRGGNADQNLIILDEAVVYNPSHLYGLVSVFNPDVVNNIQVYRDYIPANYGGRLSSVIVNRTTEGNSKEFHVNGGVSLMSGRLAVEGPIVKERGSYVVAFRRSLLDVFHSKFKLFNPQSVYYDINAKANFKVDKDNTLFYSVYYGKDRLLSENSYANNWGNVTSTLRWNHIFNSRVFLNLSAIYSDYSNLLDLNADTLSQKSQWNTGVKDMTLKADYTYFRSPTNQIKFGIVGTYHRFSPGEASKSLSDEFNIPKDRSLESALYFAQELRLNKYFELSYGLRLGVFVNAEQMKNVFDQQGNRIEKEDVKSFVNPEPRINISYLPDSRQRLFLTYNRSYQYLMLVQNSTLAFSSLEPWIPASTSIKPQYANYFSAGYTFTPDKYIFSLNGYYKKLYNQMDLIGHAQIIQNPAIRSQLRFGRSRAYGMEAQITRTEGRLSGTLAYSYSRVYKKIADLNSNEEFVANYDIPHELKLSASFQVTDRLSLQSFFIYSTGRPLTLPVGYYQHDGINVPIFEKRNQSRFPEFSRLDVSAQYHFENKLTKRRALSSFVSAGIYNLYNRKNPLYYNLNSAGMGTASIEYAFGIYPWVAYSFKF
ncbi:TonB-dependent receptor [Pedobacter sp. MC2016-24]|uniref:TonB-dependent receptor n=1 Tax=Pedobacter sp. MC2016-24 TaxID=2780090 RepID=UPI001D16325A|nr:TonB-dependent receptor [Pedobacter sp. MC2016-24]